MSENSNGNWEDEQILKLLDEMAEGSVDDPQGLSGGSDQESGRLRRGYVEVLGLLPYELEAVSPSPELKEKLLADVGAAEVTQFRQRSEDSSTSSHQASTRRLLVLVASLAFVLVGITGWQIWRVDKQAETIARLSRELDQARLYTAELAAARQLVEETQARIEMLTASSAEFCALRPTESCPNQEARGTLVMRRDESDWFLRVEGLGPCEEGRQYKLWFVTESRPVLGASFAVEGSHDLVEIHATGIPTGVRAVMITLEQPEVEIAPEAPVLLYGDERMRVL